MRIIKAEDIKIGNHFKTGEGICKVFAISTREATETESAYEIVRFKVPNDERMHSIHLHSKSMENAIFEPIKLTPDILNNNIKEAQYEEEILSEAIHLDNGETIGYDEKIIRWWMDGYYIYGDEYNDTMTFPTRVEEDGNCKSGYGMSEKEFKCTTTGNVWKGKFIERSGKFYEIEPILMKGFQGFRYYK